MRVITDPADMAKRRDVNYLLFNTAWRARKAYQEIEPAHDLEGLIEKKIEDIAVTADQAYYKDSNIESKDAVEFILEDEKGQVSSVIFAGVTSDPYRVFMATIDTADEYRGKGFFSILLDEALSEVTRSAQSLGKRAGEVPELAVSLRGMDGANINFAIYLSAMLKRGFTVDVLRRELRDEFKNHPTYNKLLEEEVVCRIDKPLANREELVAKKDKIVEELTAQGDKSKGMFLLAKPSRDLNLDQLKAGQMRRMEEKRRAYPSFTVDSTKLALAGWNARLLFS